MFHFTGSYECLICLLVYAVMSSKDSISTVLKCMVKGASDFLMKPVRKNELRNLWQHVWRRKTVCLNLDKEKKTFKMVIKFNQLNLTRSYFVSL